VCRVITSSYVIKSTDRHPNFQFQTASPPIVFGRFGPHLLPFVAKLKKITKRRKFIDDNDIICTANGWLEDQHQEFFFNGIRALENRWTKCISVEGNYVEK